MKKTIFFSLVAGLLIAATHRQQRGRRRCDAPLRDLSGRSRPSGAGD